MKRTLMLATLVASTFVVDAKIHQDRTVQGIGEVSGFVMPVDSFGVWSASQTDENTLTMVQTVREVSTSGFRERGTRTVILPDISLFEGKNTFELIAGFAIEDGPNMIIRSAFCEVSQCVDISYDLVAFDIRGDVDPTRLGTGFINLNNVLIDSCDADKDIAKLGDRFILNHGCGEITIFNLSGEVISDDVYTSLNGEEIHTMSVESNRVIDRTGKTAPPIDVNQKIIVSGLVIDGGVQSYLVDAFSFDGVLSWNSNIEINVDDGDVAICDASYSLSGVLVVCERNVSDKSLVTSWLINSQSGEGESTVDYPSFIFEGSLVSLSIASVDGRQYGIFETGNAIETINFNIDGDIYVRHDVVGSNIKGSKLENGGSYSVSSYLDDRGQFALSFYDLLFSNQGPFFQSGLGGTFPSNNDFKLPVEIADEDYLPSELTLDIGELPAFILLKESELVLDIKPEHENVGEYLTTFTVSNPLEEEKEFEATFNISLSDFSVNVFEPILFEALNIEEKNVPLSSLLSALGSIQILEDDVFELTFSLNNREFDEVEITAIDTPSWLEFLDGVLSGAPEQKDVGEYSSMTISVVDNFSPPDEEGVIQPQLFSFPLEVIEVDETFNVTSDGEMTIEIGERYNYQIEVDDEETILANMRFSGIKIPDWLVFNDSRGVLSGVPSKAHVGTHTVDISIRDEGGFLVLHSFDIVVAGDVEREQSGGSVYLFILPLLGFIAFRRRLKK